VESDERDSLERTIRTACERQEWAEAATGALRIYGPELMGYLAATTRNEEDAADAFAMFSEDLWRGLPGFRWESSLRTWSYRLARNAASRLYRSGKRRRAEVELPPSSHFSALAVEMRTSVMLQLRARAVDRVRELRDQLEPDDRTLLVLRVDRELPWSDIARIVTEGDEEPSAEDITRTSAALRKRFERIKARLHELAADLR
jgi:RNA polymerase sigma-70 factor (ECF subfamily)